MPEQFSIVVKGKDTADALQRTLNSQGIRSNVQTGSTRRQPAFGFRVSVGPVNVEADGEDLRQIIITAKGLGPNAVDALFDTLERFKDRVELFIDGEKRDISEERTQRIFAPFEEILGHR